MADLSAWVGKKRREKETKSQSPQYACSMLSTDNFEPVNPILAILRHDDSGWTPIDSFHNCKPSFSVRQFCQPMVAYSFLQTACTSTEQFAFMYYDMKRVSRVALAVKPCPRDKVPARADSTLPSFERWPLPPVIHKFAVHWENVQCRKAHLQIRKTATELHEWQAIAHKNYWCKKKKKGETEKTVQWEDNNSPAVANGPYEIWCQHPSSV